jgi:hypothetical protein
MINYEYYEDKYKSITSKEYKAKLLDDLGDYSFHPRYCRDTHKSWKCYRKTQYKLTQEKALKTRKSKEREHWRFNPVYEQTETPIWRTTRRQHREWQATQMGEFVETLETGTYIRQYVRYGDDLYYKIMSMDGKDVKLCDDYWYTPELLVSHNFSRVEFRYVNDTYYNYDLGRYCRYKKFERVA